MAWAIVIGFVVILLMKLFRNYLRPDPMSGIPGPTGSPWWQLLKPPDTTTSHMLIHQMKKKYGPVFKIRRLSGEVVVVVSDLDSMYKVLVTEGKAFAGRPMSFRTHAALAGTGILQSYRADETWKTLRKTSQRHLRQFGDGLSRLEAIITDIAEDMFSTFEEHAGSPFDPHKITFDTALNSIAFLIVGKRTNSGDSIVEKMREYERLFLKILPASAPIKMKILDVFPWIRHFGYKPWQYFAKTLELEAEIWKQAVDYAEDNPDVESICRVLRNQVAASDGSLTETDAVKTTLSLLLAGVVTTNNTFYGTINLLAHHPHIQEKIFAEIQKTQKENGREVTLQDRPMMPYTRAVLLEMLRYTSTVALGVPHQCVQDAEIAGHTVPAGTRLMICIWVLHHDEDFWENPYDFNPERFLDTDGNLVPADHPNRKHLMPFGAGTRVCLGESLAMTRLFLWLTSLVGRLTVQPAEGNEKSTTDARSYVFEGVLKPTHFKVIFEKRHD